jgi:large subunit ribosomal protein L7A
MQFEKGDPVVRELTSKDKVIGMKQSRKALREGRACRVYLACDADPAITDPIAASCGEQGIPVVAEYTMAQLGHACNITVGAAVVALLQ